ncbi:MAG: sulfurtransferase TusA family protein [Candidatus Desantisbacteria bacterium]
MSQSYIETETIALAEYLDLQGEVCPFTFVKTKLALERVEIGEVIVVVLDQGPPLENVPRSIKDEGHQIIHVERVGESFKLWVRKCGDING